MKHSLASTRSTAVLAGISGILGTLMIGGSFGVNTGPPQNATNEQLIAFAHLHSASVLWGAWLQSIGPLLVIYFSLALVHLAGASNRLAGWLTFLGGSLLMTVSLAEVIFYVAALFSNPESMGMISNNIAHVIQHLYFIVAAPAVFWPLGIIVLSWRAMPRVLGYLALLLGSAFFVLGITSLQSLILPNAVTSLAAIQAIWWLATAITLIVRSSAISPPV